jgi:quercetin dioxygenase-like cupin family protein
MIRSFMLVLSMAGIAAAGFAAPVNLLDAPPYTAKDAPGKRKLVDTKDLLMIQIALMPGQKVPKHEANANVKLLVLDGDITVANGSETIKGKRGDLIEIAYGSSMEVRNESQANATFLVIKAPRPENTEKTAPKK